MALRTSGEPYPHRMSEEPICGSATTAEVPPSRAARIRIRSRDALGRRSVAFVDPFDDAQQPRCPECGTVLETARRGYVCRACNLAFVDAIAIAERIDPMR